ncbi:methyltransferase domain-containing protein [Allokutzneria sp. A3M-2-11 16]|uniref:class I SAM-dependent DNA methyltransferase n=1 Tax=Allokutzneria sp. A3M-2-11 16 TaxID=2962043 RepID=UPI0020B8CA0E|nr:class I SAM-dependent methyltransferase [Allokutzneria sp. A3M-2-11 16]MCP3802939.1 methyltransferase domain-containing protein [Allokutzneria sp. A3M-2-11 16]
MTEPDFLRDTRASYNAMAIDYAEHFKAGIDDKPVDRAVLSLFAELVRANGNTDAVDIGSGPGHVTEYLKSLGLNIYGVDLSSEMVALARRTRPGVRFEEGSMTALDLPEGGLGGICAWYSTIHVPLERLSGVFADFRRALAPGGHLVLGFQSGDELKHYDEGFGHKLSLDFYRRSPELVAGLLNEAGFEVYARAEREPDPEEKTRQAYLIARVLA